MSENTVIPEAIVARPGTNSCVRTDTHSGDTFRSRNFLAWYFTWFGRGLSDAEITKYLSDTGIHGVNMLSFKFNNA